MEIDGIARALVGRSTELGAAEATGARRSVGSAFAEMMRDMLVDTNASQLNAADEAGKVAKGEGDIVQAVVAMNEADLSLRMVVEMRNKLVEAYQQIIRTS